VGYRLLVVGYFNRPIISKNVYPQLTLTGVRFCLISSHFLAQQKQWFHKKPLFKPKNKPHASLLLFQ